MTRFVTATTSQDNAINQLADAVNQATTGTRTAGTVTGAVVLTTGQLINGWYVASGTAGAQTVTTPTAAAIVAAIYNCQVGSMFDFFLNNGNNGTLTVTGGTNVTIVGTAAVLTGGKGNYFKGFVTNATSGTEAVTMVAMLKTSS